MGLDKEKILYAVKCVWFLHQHGYIEQDVYNSVMNKLQAETWRYEHCIQQNEYGIFTIQKLMDQ